jgi:hypothetical protein
VNLMANEANLKPWKKGQSGNPGGRKKGDAELAAMCRAACPEATEWLIAVAHGKIEATPELRLRAVLALQERGYGKPRQSIEVKGDKPFAVARLPEQSPDNDSWEREAQAWGNGRTIGH